MRDETLRVQRHLDGRGKLRKICLWLLQAFVGSLFIMSGLTHFMGTGGTRGLFEAIGYGQSLRYVTGLVQVLGGVLVFFPRKAAFGALLLSVMMLVAIGVHLFMIGGDPSPALFLFLFSAVILWLRRSSLFSWLPGSRWRRRKDALRF